MSDHQIIALIVKKQVFAKRYLLIWAGSRAKNKKG